MFIHSIVVSSWLSAQRQLSAGSLYSWSVTSSIVGPWDEASESGPLRATLPMEVVTVSIYVKPVASSLMLWPVLMVEILGVATTVMDRVLWGASEAISDGSGLHRQAVTPAKPHSGVIGQMTANACTGKEGLDGVGVSDRGAGGFAGLAWGAELVLLLASRPWMVGRSPQQPPLVRRDAGFFPTPRTLDFSSLQLALVHRVPWGHQWVGSPDSDHPPSWEGPLYGTPAHWRRRGSTLPPPSILSHSQLAGMASLQQADQSSLPNAGGPWHMLLLSLRGFL